MTTRPIVLVTGAEGQLGKSVIGAAPASWDVAAFGRAQLDVSDAAATRATMERIRPRLVVNCAAFTAVDRAESEPEAARAVNTDGAANIARAAVDCGARLIHVSTDYVFGTGYDTPIATSARPTPDSVYGATKAAGETAVLDATRGAGVVLRTSWLYSSAGDNFVTRILERAAVVDSLEVVDDQIGSPTWASELARAIWAASENPAFAGVQHWTDADAATRHEFAVAIVREGVRAGILDREPAVRATRSRERPLPARRPTYCVLDTTGTAQALGIAPRPWRENLRAVVREIARNRATAASTGTPAARSR